MFIFAFLAALSAFVFIATLTLLFVLRSRRQSLQSQRDRYVASQTLNIPLATPEELSIFGMKDGLAAKESERVVERLERELQMRADLEYYYVEPALYHPHGASLTLSILVSKSPPSALSLISLTTSIHPYMLS